MKTNFSKKVLFICLVLLSTSLLAGKDDKGKDSKKGWRESYGGDSTIADFKSNALLIVDSVGPAYFHSITNVNLTNIKQAIINSEVECKKDLQLDGHPKDAINYPQMSPQKILLNCEKYKSLFLSSQQLLSIHEYLPLVGIDDSSYQFSNSLFYQFQLSTVAFKQYGEELLNAAFDCNQPLFFRSLERGASLHHRNRNGLGKNSFEESIASNCYSIVNDLTHMREAILGTREIHHSLIDALLKVYQPHIVENFYELYSFSEMLTVLIKYDSKIVNFKSDTNEKNDMQRYYYFFDSLSPVSNPCFKDSTLLHFVARLEKESELDIVHFYEKHESKSNRIETFNRLYKKLKDLGFDENAKNICGETPKSIKEGR